MVNQLFPALFTVFGYAKGLLLETETGHQSSGCFQLLVLKILETLCSCKKQSTDGVAILKITDATFAAAIQIQERKQPYQLV
jgi:hypothetical protein